MTNPRQHASDGRLRQLDSLRGIAALFVVFNHYVQTVPERLREAALPNELLSITTWASPWPWLRFTPLRLLVGGEAAVDLFFVLSGFVLALMLTRDSQPAALPFIIKRFCRVYLPFAGVILILAAANEFTPAAPSPAMSNWVNALLVPRGGFSLSAHLLMRGHPADMRLDPVMWTLVHEMRVSLIFPAIFLSIRRIGAVPTVVTCLLVSVLASFSLSDSISGSWQATIHFLWMFVAGSALSYNRTDVARLFGGYGRRTALFLWILTLLLLIIPFDRVWSDFLIGSGAVLLICLCLNRSRITDALVRPTWLWLGRVSYSLYLIHLPILILAITGGFVFGASISIFVLTLALAEVTFRLLEQPSHQIGVRIISAIGRRNDRRDPAHDN